MFIPSPTQVQVRDMDGLSRRMGVPPLQRSPVSVQGQDWLGSSSAFYAKRMGKGWQGAGKGGHPALHQGYGRENMFGRRVLAAAWPWGYDNSPPLPVI